MKAMVVMVSDNAEPLAARLTVVGPFDSYEKAKEWGDDNIGKMMEWFATEVLPPPTGSLQP